MKTEPLIKIKSYLKEYEVCLSEKFSFIEGLVNLEHKLFVIDQNVYKLYKNLLFEQIPAEDILIIKAIEKNKAMARALEVCQRMSKLEAKRNATIVTIGGGILQDITGFAASILYRGVQWIFVPTTLLAQADSCIGSKTSLNYLEQKNSLGTFYPPSQVYIDLGFLNTLTDTDYRSGLGEVLKLHIMQNQAGFKVIEQGLDQLLNRNYALLSDCIQACLKFKKGLIEADEFDYGLRRLLNYGHSFGHALERTSNYQIPHGLGVVIGMLLANEVAYKRGYLSLGLKEAIKIASLKLLTIPLQEEYFEVESIIDAMKNDKKRQSADLTLILLQNNHNLVSIEDVSCQEISEALLEGMRYLL